MKKNMGNIDKLIRIVFALLLIGLYLLNIIEGTFGLVAAGLGLVFIITSFLGFCPLYSIIGFKTCKTEE